MFVNKLFDPSKIMGPNTFVAGKDNNRLEPKLALAIGSPDMDMGRLATFIGVKMETKSADSKNGWHAVKSSRDPGRIDVFRLFRIKSTGSIFSVVTNKRYRTCAINRRISAETSWALHKRVRAKPPQSRTGDRATSMAQMRARFRR